MLGRFFNRWRQENEQLRAEVEMLKAAAPTDLVADTAGIGTPTSRPNLTAHREQLRHFNGWQFVAIRAIAVRVAGQQVNVASVRGAPGRLQTKAVGDDLEPIPDHPLVAAIDAPNPYMVRWQLMYVTVAGLELTGKAYWWIRDTNRGLEIYPLPADWMSPEHDGGLYSRWRVRPPGVPEGLVIDNADIAYFSLPDPADPLMGAVSPLQTQARAINSDEAIQASQDIAFRAGIHPSVVVKAGRLPNAVTGGEGMRPVLTPEQRKQLITSIRNALSGVLKHGDAAIVDGMIEDIIPWSNKPAEMDWLNSGAQTKSRILQAFGVNPIVVGEVENANRASSWVAELHFCNNVVNPLLILMGQVLTARVAPRWAGPSERLKVWFDLCRADDDELKLRAWQYGLTQGAVTLNEYRRHILNLPEMEGGDETKDNSPAVSEMAKSIAAKINPYTLKPFSSSVPSVNGNGHNRLNQS